jgi:hypothetical protein
MIVDAATLFEGKVIRHVVYRHPWKVEIPTFDVPGVCERR